MRGNESVMRGTVLRAAVTAVMVLLLVLLHIPAANAAPGFSLDIPIDTVIRDDPNGPVGVIHHLDTRSVPSEFQGQECTARSVGLNQESAHPDNDLIISSGGTEVVIPDVESDPAATVDAQGTLILGSDVVVNLRMGPDHTFSAGLIVEIRCIGTGEIIVVKEVTDGSNISQAFDFAADYNTDGFALSDGQRNASGDLPPGTYSVAENVPSGWTLASANCDDGSPANAIDLTDGETVTCTFVNDETPPEPGQIIVVKEVTDGSSASHMFGFTSDYDTDGFSLSDGQRHDSGDLTPGTYSVNESVPSGWRLVSATCDDQSSVDAIDLSEGETVTCTFLNEQSPDDVLIPDDVLASIVVTVSAVCEVDGDLGVGRISVGVSVDGGADVLIRNSAGDVLASVSSDAAVTVPEGATYSWEAIPNEGFEFPAGSATSGTLSVDTCSDLETLPFTGPENASLVWVATALVAAGLMIVHLAPRKLEE